MTPAPAIRWLYRFQPKPNPRLRLICFPWAGGGVTPYWSWPKFLPDDIEVGAVHLPGRDDRSGEAPFTAVPKLVEALAKGLAPWLDIPFACYGHSLGALVAYELLRYLRRSGGPSAKHLFVSARRAPHLQSSEAPCHNLPQEAFVAELMRRYDGIPRQILAEPELLKRFLPVLRADLKAEETYLHVPAEPLDVPITAFGGSEDHCINRENLDAWKCMTGGSFQVHVLAGGHFFLDKAQPQMLRIIAQQLENRPSKAVAEP